MLNLSDRALKERVIGAIVLVVFAVLVVPIFLDGPADVEETVSEVVTLPGQNNQERKRQTIVLDQDRNEPVPAARAPVPARQEAAVPVAKPDAADIADKTAVKPDVSPEEAPAKIQPVPAPVEKQQKVAVVASSTEAQSETGMWAVQLGSFSEQQNAERLAASLRDQGYAAFLSKLQTGSASLHRVRVGPQKDRTSAESIAAQLAKGGHKGQVVPHP